MKKYPMLILLFAITFPMIAQQEKNHDVSSEVKELSEFHDIIYQIWHTAWPEKNISLLKSFAAPVEKGFERIEKAELPGILRDKKVKWEEGLKKFGVIMGDGTETGCNSVTSPGTLLGPRCLVAPNVTVKAGYYPPKSVIR